MGKRLKKLAALICLLAVTHSGCKSNPGKLVASGEVGTYTSAENAVGTESGHEIQIARQEVFGSTDGSVEFKLDIAKSIMLEPMCVAQVVPHYLTEEDIKRAAEAIFGDAEFYEAEPTFSPIYSKAEIQAKILRWSNYTTNESIQALYGVKMDHVAEIVKLYISEYTAMLETAPEDNPHRLTDWKFKKTSQYRYSPEQIEEEKIDLETENDEITLSLCSEGREYRFNAAMRNKADYKLNQISAYPYTGISPNGIDALILRAELCRTQEPTQEQIDIAIKKAESILNKIALGEWRVDEAYAKLTNLGDIPEYLICINATPVIKGIAVSRKPQLTDLKSKNVYSSNYYLTDAQMEFSPGGSLMQLRIYSPIDIEEIQENVTVIQIDDLIDMGKQWLSLSDKGAYGYTSDWAVAAGDVSCTVTISDFDFGLSRIREENSDERYCYVPSITFLGNIEYFIRESEELCYLVEKVPLLCLNAMDGSIIRTSNS